MGAFSIMRPSVTKGFTQWRNQGGNKGAMIPPPEIFSRGPEGDLASYDTFPEKKLGHNKGALANRIGPQYRVPDRNVEAHIAIAYGWAVFICKSKALVTRCEVLAI